MNAAEAKAIATAALASGALQIVPAVKPVRRSTRVYGPLAGQVRSKISRSMRVHWTPEARAQHAARMRENWQKRKARAQTATA